MEPTPTPQCGQGPTLLPVMVTATEPPPVTAGPVSAPAPAQPAPQPQQPRLGPLDPADRVTVSKGEEDLLEIPAFLRRQAN